MTEVLTWSGFVGGLAVGAYAILQLLLIGRPLGVSTGYGNLCALGSERPFFKNAPFANPRNWRLWFLLGLPLGGLIAALASPGAIEPGFSMGTLYDSVLPAALPARAVVLTLGGIAMGFGARMAGGCTSGHAIAGLSLRNLPSLVAAVGFFAGGIIVVQLLFAFGA